jgi:hypothetical protein
VYERGAVRSEALRLLTELLISNLSDREWHEFTFTAINKFLSMPSALSEDAPQQRIEQAKTLFSQRLVIDALDDIGVPSSELIQYLVKKLNIPLVPSIDW